MAYHYPTQDAGRRFVTSGRAGAILMLNLIRLRTVAEYAADPDLAPPAPISGREAYDRYVAHTLPFLSESGGGLEMMAAGGNWLVGPDDERWDIVMLVRQKDMATFLAFEQNEAYLAGIGHRTAAAEDTRLLPLTV
ncbi:MAG: DUF1330 domain-containing protein [Hyphomonas sp.]|nr:DUF1330 domain-containing protein [Hyphomonas sp.]MBU3922452.1 DUF1330 domain-containing protein [Alphaproteobacteria bacterium]MBU4062238.1 DUF1330 domain-containing protein [Alphaproteobacteria bacterium]MBU4165673.1 DUF1330 domain-containing protein [Alphaproteobacteria bacterium]